MGTYNYDWKMLVEKLKECLDNIQGDFNQDDLIKALNFMFYYQPLLDGNKGLEKFWHKKLKEVGIDE